MLISTSYRKIYWNFYVFTGVLFLSVALLKAQEIWDFPDPQINTGEYTITDTIYMAPDGNDVNPGTFSEPVLSFGKAISLLPFGTAGVKGGNAYGLIMLKEGEYIVENGMQQGTGQFEQGETYKNVSLEGIGEVTVRGMNDDFESLANGHLVHLRGSHIYIRNLTLKFAKIHGILLTNDERMTDLLVEQVEVDSVGSFSMLCTNADNIVVRDSRFLRGSRIFNDDLVSGPNCQWPSGLKFYDCKKIQAYNNEVAYTRGEGLNFHNSEYALAYGNDLHDNTSNIYCDNSARVIIRNNFNYATPGNEVFWRGCPADETEIYGCTGILLANEGACDSGGPVYGGCVTSCPLAGKEYKQIDSIYIYNNFFINTTPALNLWQGVTEPIGGPNCMRNVFFEHNTVVGVTGGPENGVPAAVYAFFPNIYNTILGFGYAIGQNIQVNANIISLPFEVYPNARICRKVLNDLFPVPFQMSFTDNLINNGNACGNGMDKLEGNLTVHVSPYIDSVLLTLQPCPDNPELIYQTPVKSYITNDYGYSVRNNESTNAGALEYAEECNTISGIESSLNVESLNYRLYPNPGNGSIKIVAETGFGEWTLVRVIDQKGCIAIKENLRFTDSETSVDMVDLSNGLYYIQLINASGIQTIKYIKQ